MTPTPLLKWLLFFTLPVPVFALTPTAARQVFDNLLQVIGRPKTQPDFAVIPDVSVIAKYSALSNKIEVSSKFLDFADRYGEQSETMVALVLGHELAHHYENHNLRMELAASENNPADLQATQRRSMEREADYFAVFFAHMAGYSTSGLDENFIHELYAEFGVSNGDKHYDSLKNRIETLQSARSEIGQLTQIFEAGNLLLLTGNPEAAAHCFEHVSMKFTSPGVWNNTGVAYFLASLEYLPEGSPADSLLFPVGFEEEMQPLSRQGDDRYRDLAPEVATALRLKLLYRALESFERVEGYGNDPPLAVLVHLACTHLLLAHESDLSVADRALNEFHLRQSLERIAFRFPGDPAAAQIALLKGLDAALAGDPETAKQYFREAAKKGSIVAKINLSQDGRPRPPDDFSDSERFHDLSLLLPEGKAALRNLVGQADAITLPGWSYTLTIRCQPLSAGQAIWIEFLRPDLFRKTTVYAVQAGKGYRGMSARGVGLGSTEKQVQEKYGLPEKALVSRRQEYWTYPEAGVVFCLSNRTAADIFHFYCEEEDE